METLPFIERTFQAEDRQVIKSEKKLLIRLNIGEI
jgi:hypothetical protein